MFDNVPLVEVAKRQHGIVTRSQLACFGLDRQAVWRRCDGGLLAPVYPAVFRVSGAPQTWEQEAMAACAWGGGSPERWPGQAKAVLSHRAAARLHGLERFKEAAVEIITMKRPQFGGAAFIAHQGTPDTDFVVLIEGIPVTNMARTLIDLAEVLSTQDLDHTVDDALRWHKVREPWLRYAIEHVSGPGCRGAKRMAALLDARGPMDAPSASAFQKDLRQLILGAGFPFAEEYAVPGLRYRCDLGSGAYAVVVEGDSEKHHSGSQDWAKDKVRENEITATGHVMLKFTPDDLKKRPRWILKTVEATLRSRGWPGPPAAALVRCELAPVQRGERKGRNHRT